MKRKITIGIIVLLVASGGYFLSRPMLYVENRPARDVSCKVFPTRNDSVVLLIPYKLILQNNRWKPLALRFVSDGNRNRIHPDNLLYNANGTALDNYYDPGYKDLWDDYVALHYRNTVFPFWGRTFYYFRPFRFSRQALNPFLAGYTDEQIKVQLMDLHENFPMTLPASLLDSLYGTDKGHRFELHFEYGTLDPTIRAITGSTEQQVVNLRDSIRHMDIEEAKEWLQEYWNRQLSMERQAICNNS